MKDDELVSRARAALKERCEDDLDMFVDKASVMAELAESPIELMMGIGLLAAPPPYCMPGERAVYVSRKDQEVFGVDPMARTYTAIQQQVEISSYKRYRADFMIYVSGAKQRHRIVIECDGHDFHEKTKAQAQRDKSRDRFFISHGVPVLRYSGSEIFKDPYAAASAAYSEIEGYVHDTEMSRR